MGDKRRLAIRILLVNIVVLALLALATWLAWLPVPEARRGVMTAAFAACAALDAVLALFLVART